jgi:hypothetical protein
MDWIKQFQGWYQDWAELQIKTWQDWFEAVQGADKLELGLIWEKSIAAWQGSVNSTLQTQVEGVRLWAEGVKAIPGLPKEATTLVQPLLDVTEDWIEMQQQFSDRWFEVVKQNRPHGVISEPVQNKPAPAKKPKPAPTKEPEPVPAAVTA